MIYNESQSLASNLENLKNEIISTDTFNKQDLMKFTSEAIRKAKVLERKLVEETQDADRLRRALNKVIPLKVGNRVEFADKYGFVINADGGFCDLILLDGDTFSTRKHVGIAKIKKVEKLDEQIEEQISRLLVLINNGLAGGAAV